VSEPEGQAPYPFGEPDVVDLGLGVFLLWDGDGQGFLWHHWGCRPWASLRFQPDPRSTGHRLESREPLTIAGSLLCPMGCGFHGFIRSGRWIPA
jgi:hypothetical protein